MLSKSFSADALSGKQSKKCSVPKRVTTLSGDATPGGIGVEYLFSGDVGVPVSACPALTAEVNVEKSSQEGTDQQPGMSSHSYSLLALHDKGHEDQREFPDTPHKAGLAY